MLDILINGPRSLYKQETKGTSIPLKESSAINDRSGPRPRRTLLPFLSTRVTYPRTSASGITGSKPLLLGLLSPLMTSVESCLISTTRWTVRPLGPGGSKATTSPRRGDDPLNGETVTISPSLIKGDILPPLASNLKRALFPRTALMSSPRDCAEICRLLSHALEKTRLVLCNVNNHPSSLRRSFTSLPILFSINLGPQRARFIPLNLWTSRAECLRQVEKPDDQTGIQVTDSESSSSNSVRKT